MAPSMEAAPSTAIGCASPASSRTTAMRRCAARRVRQARRLAGSDAVGEAWLALHRAPRGGRDRSAERGGGVDGRADPADQADGVGVPEPRAPRERDPVPSPKAGSPSEAGLNPHDCLKRQKCVVPTRICPNKGARRWVLFGEPRASPPREADSREANIVRCRSRPFVWFWRPSSDASPAVPCGSRPHQSSFSPPPRPLSDDRTGFFFGRRSGDAAP